MRILMIVPPGRKDYYYYLQEDNENDYLLLWHESKEQLKKSPAEIPTFFKEFFFWDEYATPSALFKNVRPDKIIFFEIIDQRQIALIVAARKKGITSFYLEHGAAGSKETAASRSESPDFIRKQKLPYLIGRLKNSLGQILKTKFFYYSNFSGFKNFKNLISYWKLPFLMLRYTPNKSLAKCIFPERVPHYSIVFNKVNFYEYQLYTGISQKDALFTGVPFFDKFYQSTSVCSNHIIYIEQPFLEEGLLNWTSDHHSQIATDLYRFAVSNKRKLYIKLHPRSNKELWNQMKFDDTFFTVLQDGDFTNLFLTSSLILGYSSSLITGFLCARKNVVLLGWHPTPGVFGNDFSKSGLCHLSLSSADLLSKLESWESKNLCYTNGALYEHYLKDYNNPFDGRSAHRVLHAIQTL